MARAGVFAAHPVTRLRKDSLAALAALTADDLKRRARHAS